MTDQFAVRDATVLDLPAIVKVYNYYVETSTATFDEEPQTLEQRLEWFERHGDRYPVLVAELNGVVVGWASISPFSERPAYRLTVESSVYVHFQHIGRGFGTKLMTELIARAKSLGYHCMVARIADGNEDSIRLHEKLGFRRVGTMEEVGYKFGRWLNVAIMMLPLT
jgi:L-amino acid N-acyltransferase YncA